MIPSIARFALGQVVITRTALMTLPANEPIAALARHQAGDWGDLCPEDHAANARALLEGTRIVSVYHTRAGVKFYIITEWDRSLTTILIPEDY